MPCNTRIETAVPRDQWPHFCRQFSRRRRGARRYVAAVPTDELDHGFQADDVQTQIWKSLVKFESLDFDVSRAELTVAVEDRPDALNVGAPAGLFAQQGPEGSGIRVASQDGYSLIVRFPATAPADPAAGWAAAAAVSLGDL